MHSVDSCTANDCNSGMGKGARSRLARKLKLLRVMREWSQEELADASGLHRTHISLIERSACNVTLDNLEQIANAFGISLPELLDATELADVARRSAAASRTSRKKRGRHSC